jgi:hypothetical protein
MIESKVWRSGVIDGAAPPCDCDCAARWVTGGSITNSDSRPTRPDGGGGVTGGERIDCLAGVVRLELEYPCASHVFEMS